jgi:EAL domain-containing protein (putative c-di-GMP-specific phosphodiesterase class I)
VTFGKEIGSMVVAEGVETAAELEALTDLGIGYGQGFYLGRPGSLDDLSALRRGARRRREPALV